MRCFRKKRDTPTHVDRLGVGAAGVCALLALSFLMVPAAFCQTAPAEASPAEDKAQIRIAGPSNAQGLVEALAEEFRKSKSGAAATMEYLCRDAAGAAVEAVLAGHDMMLCWGRVPERDIAGWKKLWELPPDQHVVGARAMAIVVHLRNPLDSLTRKQLEAIFSGKTANWRGFGGELKPIQCYGLPISDPLTKYFQDDWFPTVGRGPIVRKKTSAEVLAALSTDPGAIAYVDAAAVATAGDTAKLLEVGGVAPDVQSVKDGTYPFAEVLVLCVSPKPSQAAKDFSQFVLTGKGDVVLRRCG